MELAIPLIALGGMYVISNQPNENEVSRKIHKQSQQRTMQSKPKENFTNMGKKPNYLPNVISEPQNYPIMNQKELVDTVQEYVNPNVATDKYFDQTVYQQKERQGVPVGSTIQQVYSLTGNYVSKDEFRHNNMNPFNGAKPRGQEYNVNTAETILDNYSGSGSQVIKKIEQAPLFKPQENVQWAYGTPNMSEFYQSRVNPAMRNNMVKPFESVRVGPGLNKGYESSGSGGFNSGMESRDQWLPKTVDELRIATNPKEVYSLIDHQGPAQTQIKNVGVLGKVEKYRPDTFFINTQDRWLTTTGAEKAGRIVADEVLKDSSRAETTKEFYGTPNAILKTASYVPKHHEDSKRQQLEGFNVSHSNASGRGPHIDGEEFMRSHTNYTNNRCINQQPQTFGSGFSKALGAVMAPIMDVLKPVKKQEYSNNLRVYGNVAGEVPGNYVINEGDSPGPTIKETTLYQPNTYIGNQTKNAAYMVSEHQPISNQRDTTGECNEVMPMGGAGSRYGAMSYDHAYRQTNNESKEKTIKGRYPNGNTSTFNSNVNVSIAKVDADRNNNRLWAPSAVVHQGPSVQTYGRMNQPQYINADPSLANRLDGGLLEAFKANPYTHSLSSVA
jgi:hypothetical protein